MGTPPGEGNGIPASAAWEHLLRSSAAPGPGQSSSPARRGASGRRAGPAGEACPPSALLSLAHSSDFLRENGSGLGPDSCPGLLEWTSQALQPDSGLLPPRTALFLGKRRTDQTQRLPGAEWLLARWRCRAHSRTPEANSVTAQLQAARWPGRVQGGPSTAPVYGNCTAFT